MPAVPDNTNASTHQMYSVVARGVDALKPEQKNRLQELKIQLATEPGRLDYRIELAANIAIICELGLSELQKAHKNGSNIYDTNVIKILGSYQNALARLLSTWPHDGKPRNLEGVIEGLMKGKEEDGETPDSNG